MRKIRILTPLTVTGGCVCPWEEDGLPVLHLKNFPPEYQICRFSIRFSKRIENELRKP